MTALLSGPAGRFSPGHLQEMIKIASAMLAEAPAITVTVGGIWYHPEAIMLTVRPKQALAGIHDAVQAATHFRQLMCDMWSRKLRSRSAAAGHIAAIN